MAAYSNAIWEHFKCPLNVGRVEEPTIETRAGGRYTGPFFVLSARIIDDIIEDIKYQTFGCVPAIAAGSILTNAIKGATVQEAKKWSVERLIETCGGLPQDKHYCASLAIDALTILIVSCCE